MKLMNKLILEAHELFKDCGFDYCICGGYALDMFADKELRPHGDFDIVVFKENKRDVIKFLQENGWLVYGRFMEHDKPITLSLFYIIKDPADSRWDDCVNIWAAKPGGCAEMYPVDGLDGVYSYIIHEPRLANLDFLEFEFDERESGEFILQKSPKITRPLSNAILYKDEVPYLAPELVLFYKTDEFSSAIPYLKIKTKADFRAIMPLLPQESRAWLMDAVDKAYPEGYGWLADLPGFGADCAPEGFELLDQSNIFELKELMENDNMTLDVTGLRKLRGFVDTDGALGFLYRLEGKPIGLAYGCRLAIPDGTKELYLHSVDILPNFRNEKHGGKFFESILDFAQNNGFSKLFLCSSKSLKDVRHIYEGHGGIKECEDEIIFYYPLMG
jgi:GNAT superfamily N-acetyltransferase